MFGTAPRQQSADGATEVRDDLLLPFRIFYAYTETADGCFAARACQSPQRFISFHNHESDNIRYVNNADGKSVSIQLFITDF